MGSKDLIEWVAPTRAQAARYLGKNVYRGSFLCANENTNTISMLACHDRDKQNNHTVWIVFRLGLDVHS